MNSILKIFIATIALSFIGIAPTSGQQIYTDSEFYEMEKDNKAVRSRSKFKFKRKSNTKKIDFSKIDTNAVYISFHSDNSFSYMRFFKDAVFKSGPYYSRPSGQELENLTYGVWRCYTMTRKGLLVVATPKRFEMDSRWIYYFGNIYSDKIEITHYHFSLPSLGSSPGYLQTPWTYEKQIVEFENRKYVWK